MATMLGTALLEFPQRLWNLFKSHSSNPPNREASEEIPVTQTNKQTLGSVSDFVLERLRVNLPAIITDPLSDEEDTMPRRKTQHRKAKPSLTRDSNSEDLSDIDVKNEKLWDGSQPEPYEHVTADDEDFEDWSSQELDFFNSLNDRGLTPMLWTYWKVDFPTLPESLFTAEKEDALIKNWKGLASTGAKALNTLVKAGIYARERRKSGQDAAQLLAKEIDRYIKWSIKDAKWRNKTYIPLIVVNSTRRNEKLETAQERGRSRVRTISEEYKELWAQAKPSINAPLPTIFHVFLAKTIMGFESFDISAEEPEFRSIFFTDWKQLGHDIWNAMAIAILVEQCRSWLNRVDPKRPLVTESFEIDPDL